MEQMYLDLTEHRNTVCRSVPRTLWGLFTIFAGIKATLIKITAAKIEKKKEKNHLVQQTERC